MEAAIADTPVDFVITEGVRTQARQQSLYAQGRTAAGPKVTNADGVRNKSNHQAKADGYGHAVDLYPFVDGVVRVAEPYVDGKLKEIAGHIKAVAARLGVAITWGGDWKNPYDPPHFELKK
jgi:peptidoglycan L-alanyl-D-glutamate endopeptidase CwlK